MKQERHSLRVAKAAGRVDVLCLGLGRRMHVGMVLMGAMLTLGASGSVAAQVEPSTDEEAAQEKSSSGQQSQTKLPSAVALLDGASSAAPPTAEMESEGGQNKAVATGLDAVSRIESLLSSVDGIRLHGSAKIRSVSGRVDFRGRVIVTVVGSQLGDELPRVFLGEALRDLDGSGLLAGVSLEYSELASGTGLVIATFETFRPAEFRVSVVDHDVVVTFRPKVGTNDAEPVASRDPISGRRVLTAEDLQPIDIDGGHGGGANKGALGVAQGASGTITNGPQVPLTTSSRVNLRPVPSLASTPLMVLPAETPLVGIGEEGNWRRVALGELQGWVDNGFLVERVAEVVDVPIAQALDLGDPGAWEDRLAESLRQRKEGTYGQQGALGVSDRELSLRERAWQEATSRRLDTAQQDLRAARVESAELRIELAGALQRLELVEGELATARDRVGELEGILAVLRERAVSHGADLARASTQALVLGEQLEQAQADRSRLHNRSLVLERERLDARSTLALLEIEADALRVALRAAETELAVVPYLDDGPLDLKLGADASALRTPLDVPETGREIQSLDNTGTVESGLDKEQEPSERTAPEVSGVDPGLSERAGPSKRERKAIEAMLRQWAVSWSAQSAESYFAFYSANFRPAQETLEVWKSRRRERLRQPEWIEIEVLDLRLTVVPAEPRSTVRLILVSDRDPARFWVRAEFQQSYRSSNYQDVVEKVLLLGLEPSGWRIVREQAEHVVSGVPGLR